MGLVIRHNVLVGSPGGIVVPPPTGGLAVPPPTAGVLAGVPRTTWGGSNRFDVAGVTVSNVNMNFGPNPIYILANNITFNNVQIDSSTFFAIDADYGFGGLNLDHVTVAGVGGNNSCLNTGKNTVLPWRITNSVFTAYENGVCLSGAGLFEGNYIHHLGPLGGAGEAHVDGIAMQGGANGIIVRGNWIESFDTSDIIISDEFGVSQNITIEGNTLIGDPNRTAANGNVTAYAIYANGPGIVVRNNRIQKGQWGGTTGGYCGYARADLVWTGNVDYYTGLPVAAL
jgi:hypothetical protein